MAECWWPDRAGPTHLTSTGRGCFHRTRTIRIRSLKYRAPERFEPGLSPPGDSNRGSHRRERLEPRALTIGRDSKPGSHRREILTQALTAGSDLNPGSHHRERLEPGLSPGFPPPPPNPRRSIINRSAGACLLSFALKPN